jgi:hypothetical protein
MSLSINTGSLSPSHLMNPFAIQGMNDTSDTSASLSPTQGVGTQANSLNNGVLPSHTNPQVEATLKMIQTALSQLQTAQQTWDMPPEEPNTVGSRSDSEDIPTEERT